jgi:hypothetical protein
MREGHDTGMERMHQGGERRVVGKGVVQWEAKRARTVPSFQWNSLFNRRSPKTAISSLLFCAISPSKKADEVELVDGQQNHHNRKVPFKVSGQYESCNPHPAERITHQPEPEARQHAESQARHLNTQHGNVSAFASQPFLRCARHHAIPLGQGLHPRNDT